MRPLSPANVSIDLYDGLASLPHFNPDLDALELPIVRDFICKVRNSEGLIISTPEYAHGVPGTLKNAFDWLVSSDAFIKKPFMLLNASSRAIYAQQSLIEILKTMSGILIEQACATIPLLGKDKEYAEILNMAENREILRRSVALFVSEIKKAHQARMSAQPFDAA